MDKMREVNLPSGAVLMVMPSPFGTAKTLYQAILKEVQGIAISSTMEMATLYKDLFCKGFTSPAVEAALWECMKRCTCDQGKGQLKITPDTFEPVERRDDFMKVCVEVAKENVMPFMKSLYAEFGSLFGATENPPT
jgi:hypothetical protein